MKRSLLLIALLSMGCGLLKASRPDSAYLFSYTTLSDEGRSGLHFAWSADGAQPWHEIGPEFAFLRSDYGRWGSQKRMKSPSLFQGQDGLWHCIWGLNEEENRFAHAASADLITWGKAVLSVCARWPMYCPDTYL